MVVEAVGALDLWTLLVVNVFGDFLITIIGLMALMFIIMGFLGRVSIYTCLVYNALFFVLMMVGYGYAFYAIPAIVGLLIWAVFSWKSYVDRGGGGS